VATMGSSLSPSQARLLMPLVSTIIVLYDGDETGRKGADEIKKRYSSLFKIEIKQLPDGTDPDTVNLGAIL
jgi:DNA primase